MCHICCQCFAKSVFTLSKFLVSFKADFNSYAIETWFFSRTVNWIHIQLTDDVRHCPAALRNWNILWCWPLCRLVPLPSSPGCHPPNIWASAQTRPPRKLSLLIRQGPRELSQWPVFAEAFQPRQQNPWIQKRCAMYHFIMETCIIGRHEHEHFWSVILSLWNNSRVAAKLQK